MLLSGTAGGGAREGERDEGLVQGGWGGGEARRKFAEMKGNRERIETQRDDVAPQFKKKEKKNALFCKRCFFANYDGRGKLKVIECLSVHS